MSSTVVVAIPSDDDPVWKVSSEKVPHLTLLYLGDQSDNPKLGQMAEYLQHAASTMLTDFGLSVDRRGLLGENSADVLFFEDNVHTSAAIKHFRSAILRDAAFQEAFNTSEQFPTWTPHLTLGFPETPAREDDREYPGFHWVTFDRIALWMGDSTGPEYRLGKHGALTVAHAETIVVEEPRMTENVSRTEEDTAAFLSHYGVPGMKWGRRMADGNSAVAGPSARAQAKAAKRSSEVTVSASPGRKASAVGGVKRSASEDAKAAAASRQIAKKSTTDALSNKELQSLVTRMNLEQQYSRLASNSQKSAGRKFLERMVKNPEERKKLQRAVKELPPVEYYNNVKSVGDTISRTNLRGI